MSDSRNKRQSRKHQENLARVRQLFMREWDPIGVADVPAARDEYDTYVARAYSMLMQERATVEAIASYLSNVATDRMGFENTKAGAEACVRTASMLVSMYSDLKANLSS